MIVVDASSVVDVLLGTRAAAAIEARWRRDGGRLHAPHLLDIEVLSALRHLVLTGVSLAQWARAKKVKKTASGYEKVAA